MNQNKQRRHSRTESRELIQIVQEFKLSLPAQVEKIKLKLDSIDQSNLEEVAGLNIQIGRVKKLCGIFGYEDLKCALTILEQHLGLVYKRRNYNPEVKEFIYSTMSLCEEYASSGICTTQAEEDSKLTIHLSNPENEYYFESSLNVLLIESDPMICQIIEMIMSTANPPLNVFPCSSFAEGLKTMNRIEPEVVILDLQIVDSPGLKAVEMLRKAQPDVTILVLTNDYCSDLASKAVLLGAQDFLHKEKISSESLIRCIHHGYMRDRAKQKASRLRAIEDFTNVIAHDMHMPLQSMRKVQSIILENQDIPDDLKNHVAVIQKTSNRLWQMLDKVLKIYRLEFGHVKLKIESLDLAEIIKSIIDRNTDSFNSKGIKFKGFCPDSLTIKSDYSFVETALSILIENIGKHGLENSDALIVVERSVKFTKITFNNQGATIDGEKLKKVFKSFLTSTPGSSYVAQTGLGLYYLNQIVKTIGGKIECSSNEGWTTFSMTLPNNYEA